MQQYEMAVIFDTELLEEERNSFIERLEGIITNFSGEITDREEWGTRKLAYRIQKKGSGFYFFLRYSGGRGVVEEIERVMRLSENVLRFLTTRYDQDLKGKISPPPPLEEMLQRDILALQNLKSQWRKGVGRGKEEEVKSMAQADTVEAPSPEKKVETQEGQKEEKVEEKVEEKEESSPMADSPGEPDIPDGDASPDGGEGRPTEEDTPEGEE